MRKKGSIDKIEKFEKQYIIDAKLSLKALEFIKNDACWEEKSNKKIKDVTNLIILSNYKSNPVIKISGNAFYNCSSLTSVVLPNSVEVVGEYAFAWCTNLTSIKYSGSSSKWKAMNKGANWDYYTGRYTITYNYTGA